MSRIRWVILGVSLILLAGRGSDYPTVGGQAERLDGAWTVTSVQREGDLDPLQVGAQVTFTGNQVQFQPKVVQIVDGTS